MAKILFDSATAENHERLAQQMVTVEVLKREGRHQKAKIHYKQIHGLAESIFEAMYLKLL